MTERWARNLFATTALCALIGTAISVVNAANNTAGHFRSPAARALNAFAYFTIDSNIVAGVGAALLAMTLKRVSTEFGVLRLAGLVCIAVTGIVFNVALRGVFDLTTTWERVANDLVHVIVPIVMVIGWLLAGPRKQFSTRIVWLSLIFPACWLAFTLIRGAIIHWYPYPFINVTVLGYPRALLNCVWVALLLLALAGLANAVDRRLPDSGNNPPPVSNAG